MDPKPMLDLNEKGKIEKEEDVKNSLYQFYDLDSTAVEEVSNQVAADLDSLALKEPSGADSGNTLGASDVNWRNGEPLFQRSRHADQEVYRGAGLETLSAVSQLHAAQATEQNIGTPFKPLGFGLQQLQQQQQLREPPQRFADLPLGHAHIYVCSIFSELINLLRSLFRDLEVDANFDDTRAEWQGLIYPLAPNRMVQFSVHVTSCPQLGSNRFLLEFVRRDGCAIAFYEMFLSIQVALLDRRLVTKSNGDYVKGLGNLRSPFSNWSRGSASSSEGTSSPRVPLSRSTSSTLSALSLDDDDDSLPEIDVPDEELYRPIVEMSQVPFVDIHVQGLALVASEARKDAQRFFSAYPDIFKLLVDRLSVSKNCEVRHLCCTALALFAQNADCLQQFVDAGAPNVLAETAACDMCMENAEVQRQAAKSLLFLSKKEGSKEAILAAVKQHQAKFEQLEKADDSRLTESILGLRTALAGNT